MNFETEEESADKRNKQREHTCQVTAAVIRTHCKTFLFKSNLCTSKQEGHNIDFFS